jgi:hypothetical protein
MTRNYEQFSGPERLTLAMEALARGDQAEADRLAGSCPRKQYTMREAAYGNRLDTAFDIMCIACIDLRALWCKLDTLEFAIISARYMATSHQITATFAFMEGEGFANGQTQMEFFGKRQDDEDEDENGAGDPGVHPDDEPALTAPQPIRASAYRDGEYARRMMAVEDRMQVTTDDTFKALLHVLHAAARDLAEVWTAYDRFCRDRLGVSAETMLAAWQFPTGGEVTAMLKRYDGHVKPDPAKVDEYYGIYCRSWDHRFGDDE